MKDERVRNDRVLVYSTDGSLPLPAPAARRASSPSVQRLPDDGVVRILREKRRASTVTIVHGLTPSEATAVGKDLKRICGTGGTTKNGIVELQGDHRDAVERYFSERGRRVKRAGG